MKKCSIIGCKSYCRNKGIYTRKDGAVVRRYGNKCVKHHKKSNNHYDTAYRRSQLDNSKCSRCGWDKAYCDRHRIDPTKGYTPENVAILCPNCHRLEHISNGAVPDKITIDD